jgi:hypothetical protein
VRNRAAQLCRRLESIDERPGAARGAVVRAIKHLVPKPIRQFIKQPAYTFDLYTSQFAFERRLRKAPPVFVFQMGKVASSSIFKSLSEQYPGNVVHGHDFYEDHEYWRISRIYDWSIKEKQKTHIISLTREPVGRNISAFFQNFERDTGVAYAESNHSIDELRTLFLENYDHDIPLEWFQKNIQGNFHIDVYAEPFPASGFNTYAQANIRLLVMRSELEDSMKVRAVKDFLGLETFQLANANIGSQKVYAPTYRRFKDEVRLPEAYVQKMCGSTYFNHFYPKETIEAVERCWTVSGA